MKRKALPILISALLACSATAILFACGDNDEETPDTYSVTYVKSGTETGSVPTDATKYEAGAQVTVKGKGDLALEGYDFLGWTYGGKTYAEGDKLTMPASNVELKAEWKEEEVVKYTVTYVLGTGAEWVEGSAPATSIAAGTKITLPGLYDATKDGEELYSWTIDGQSYDLGAEYTVSGDVTITAVWGAERVAVAYTGGAYMREDGGRHQPGAKITVIDVPEEWASETKEFVRWEYSYYVDEEVEGAVKNEELNKWLVTETYEKDDEFTVPEGGATLKAVWNYVGIYVTFIVDKNDFSTEPVKVLYKPGQEEAFAAQIPTLPNNAPEGTEYHWIYENSYEENDTSYIEYVVCDMGQQTLAMLADAIEAGTEEVEVYGECSKIVPSLTLNAWNTVASSVPFQYGQKVTLTADIKVTGNNEYLGVFGYLAQADDSTVNTKLRWDWWFADNPGNGADQTKYEALKVKTAKDVVITKDGVTVENTLETLISLFPNISNFQIVADYTTEGTIVITVSFTSYTVETVGEEEVTHSYSYTGTATYTVLDPHVGLAQKYLFGIGGQGTTVKNVKFIVDGEIKTVTPPEYPNHDWTEENDWVCTVCDKINPAHPHDYDEDDICTICGEPNPSHTHRYTKGICSVCGGVEAYAADNGYTAIDKTMTKDDDWLTETVQVGGSNLTLAKGNTMVVLGTQTQNFANHSNTNWYSLAIEFAEGYTLRSDNYGWAFGESPSITAHEGAYDITYVDGKTGNVDKWVDFKAIAADCNWCVVYDWTGDNLVVTLYMTAKSGALEGCTYHCAYTLTTAETLETVTLKLGGDHFDQITIDGYKVIEAE